MAQPPAASTASSNAAEQQQHFLDPRVSAPRMAPRRSSYELRHLDAVLQAATIPPGGRVLELGAGMGRFSLLMAERGLEVTATDLSAPLLEVLREHDTKGRVRTLVADAVAVDESVEGPFDAVVGFFFLHHLPTADAVFAAARRVLKPGGRLVLCEPHAWFPGYYVQIALTPGMRWKADRGIVGMRSSALHRALLRNGLAPVPLPSYGLFPPALANRRSGRTLESWLERLPRWLLPRAFLLIAGERA